MSRLDVEYRGGTANVIAGDTGQQGDGLMLTDPWDNDYYVTSGHKREHGPGGFEFLAPPGDGYRISIGFSYWVFDHEPGMTFLTWEGNGPQPTPSPGPTPEPTPSPEPPSPGPTPRDIQVLPGHVYSAVLEGDEVVWHEGKRADAAYWFTGYHLPGTEMWLPEREPATLELLGAWLAEVQQRVDGLRLALASPARSAARSI